MAVRLMPNYDVKPTAARTVGCCGGAQRSAATAYAAR
jgi:hypothetical protein